MQTYLCTLGMPKQTNRKRLCQLTENFYVYWHPKNQFHHSLLSRDIARFCKFVSLGNLGMTGHAYQN